MRRTFSCLVPGLMTVLVLASPAAGSNGSQHGAISIQAYEAPLEDILGTFAEMNRAELDLDPAVTGRISIGVGAVSWTTALDLVCESVGCRWTLSGPQPRTLTVVPGPREKDFAPIDLHLQDAEPQKVLRSFGSILERETMIEGELRGKVTFLFESVSPLTALTATCESLGCLWELSDDALRIWVAPDPGRTGSEQAILDALFAPINLSLEKADARAVLGTFEKILGCAVEMDPSIEGQVTVERTNTETYQVLTELCRQVGCLWSLSERDGRSVLVFAPAHQR